LWTKLPYEFALIASKLAIATQENDLSQSW